MPYVDHAHETRVDDHLGARRARLMRGVNRAAVKRDAVQRALQNRVLLRVQTTNAMSVHDLASHVEAMRQTFRRAVVAGRENAFVLHNNRADLRARAS